MAQFRVSFALISSPSFDPLLGGGLLPNLAFGFGRRPSDLQPGMWAVNIDLKYVPAIRVRGGTTAAVLGTSLSLLIRGTFA